MKYNESDDKLDWRVNPRNLGADELDMAQFVNIVKLAGYDPQKVGKNETFYLQAEDIFRKI